MGASFLSLSIMRCPVYSTSQDYHNLFKTIRFHKMTQDRVWVNGWLGMGSSEAKIAQNDPRSCAGEMG